MDISQLSPQIQAALQSPEAKQLMAHLNSKDAATKQRLSAAVQSGDAETIRRSIAPLLQDPALTALLQQLTAQGGV